MEKYVYVCARLSGLAIKPLLLAWLSWVGYADLAYQVGLFFFLTAATYVVLNSEAHKSYYELCFTNSKRENRQNAALMNYVIIKILHILTFIPLIAVGILFYSSDLEFSIAFAAILIVEKFWDECQRYLIFNKEYYRWSIFYFFKNILIAICVAFSLLLDLKFIFSALYGSAFFGVLLFAFFNRGAFWSFITEIKGASVGKFMIKYLNKYPSEIFMSQIGAFVVVNLLYVDKWFLSPVLDKEVFVELVLISQVGSVFLITVDNFYFALNRGKYIDKSLNWKAVVSWPKFTIFAVLFVVVFGFSFYLYSNISDANKISINVAFLIVASYVLVGYTRPLWELVFWRLKRYIITSIDGSMLLIASAAIYWLSNKSDLFEIYLVLVLIIFVRLIIYLFVNILLGKVQKPLTGTGRA